MDYKSGIVKYGSVTRDPRFILKFNSVLLHLFIFFGTLGFSFVVLSRLGVSMFVVALIGMILGTIYAFISFKSLPFPFSVWLLSIGGFKYFWSVQTAGLPDLYIDRLAMIWLGGVFIIKFFAERRSLRGPYTLDVLLFLNMVYIFILIYVIDMEKFHTWILAYLTPYAAYYLAKNIMTDPKWIRRFFLWLLLLSVWYHITSIGEKFDSPALVWPHFMLEPHREWAARSNGPFRSAPIFGTIIGMLIPIHFYFIKTARSKVMKVVMGISLALGFAGLYFTYTRGCWLVGIVAMGVAMALNRKDYLKPILPLLIVIPILAVAFLGMGQDSYMKDRMDNEDTLGARVGTMATCLRMWKDYPFFGVGIFRYAELRDNYIESVDIPGMATIKFVQFRGNAIHDIYFGPLVETGLVGTSLQFSIYITVFVIFIKKYRVMVKEKDHFAVLIMPLMGGLFLSFMVGGIAIDYRYASFLSTLFYTCAGLMNGYRSRGEPVWELDDY